jgi:hypothetical protein
MIESLDRLWTDWTWSFRSFLTNPYDVSARLNFSFWSRWHLVPCPACTSSFSQKKQQSWVSFASFACYLMLFVSICRVLQLFSPEKVVWISLVFTKVLASARNDTQWYNAPDDFRSSCRIHEIISFHPFSPSLSLSWESLLALNT